MGWNLKKPFGNSALIASKGKKAIASGFKSALTDSSGGGDAEAERQQIAADIAFARFGRPEPGDPLDRDIQQELDEPFERQWTADWLNTTVAPQIARQSRYWHWVYIPADEVEVKMLSEFAYLCYAHLAPKIPIAAIQDAAQHKGGQTHA